jgi:hypothetical protein
METSLLAVIIDGDYEVATALSRFVGRLTSPLREY